MPKKVIDREWYRIRSILGYDALFYFLIGGREAGKSYATTEYFVGQWRKYKRPFYWLRLTEASAKKLLCNNAEKLIDPDIRRKYNLTLKTKGDGVYEVLPDGTKVLMARVLALNTFYNDKGSGLFDKDFLNDPNMYYNICLDEMNREKSEKKAFDIVYAFANQLENLVRSTKQRMRIICIGNDLEEASDILSCLNFLPESHGRYYLRKKRAVIDYIPLSAQYKARRKGTVADILAGDNSTFTNEQKVDKSRLYKGRLRRPIRIIKFDKSESRWFTLWDNGIVACYNKETCKPLAMKPYLAEEFIPEERDYIINLFNIRQMWFKNLMSQKKFQKELELLKPRG